MDCLLSLQLNKSKFEHDYLHNGFAFARHCYYSIRLGSLALRQTVFRLTLIAKTLVLSTNAWATPQIALTGLYVNGVETETIDTIEDAGKYYLPFNLMVKQLGITPTETADKWQFALPIGDASIAKNNIVEYQGIRYLPLQAVKPLGVTAKYNSQLLAIQLYVPWDSKNPFPSKQGNSHKTGNNPIKVDYYPKMLGLNNLTVSGNFSYQQSGSKQTGSKQTGSEQKSSRQNSLEQQTSQQQISNSEKSEQTDNKSELTNQSVNLGMTGYLGNGIWGTSLRYFQSQSSLGRNDNSLPVQVDNLYWTQVQDKTAFRVGTNSVGYADIASNDYTGLTLGYSNKNIWTHLSGYNASNRSLLSNGGSRDLRNIKGRGPAGGIAELRIYGRVIARVRIALDRRYEFLGLDISRLYASDDTPSENDVEVAIYEYSLSAKPIAIHKPLLTRRQANVSTKELMVEAGIGKVGNFFNEYESAQDDKAIYAHTYAEYGINNSLAARTAVSDTYTIDTAKHDIAAMAGINLGVSKTLNWDMAYRYLPKAHELDSYLTYNAKKYDANYRIQNTKFRRKEKLNEVTASNSSIIGRNRLAHYLTFNARPMGWLTVQINATSSEQELISNSSKTSQQLANQNADIGQSNISDKTIKQQYWTASVAAELNKNLDITLRKDRYDDFGYGVNWSIPHSHTHVKVSGNDKEHGVYASTNVSDDLNVAGSVKYQTKNADTEYQASANYQISDEHKFYAGFNYHKDNKSFEVNWDYRPNRHGSWRLGYQNNMSSLSFANSDDDINGLENQENRQNIETNVSSNQHFVFLQFNLNFYNHPTLGLMSGYHQDTGFGTVVTDIQVDSDNSDIVFDDKIQMQLDDYNINAYKVAGNQYMVENVKAGTYKLKLSGDNLPLEYQASQLAQPVIKVRKAATTVVPIRLSKTYGISGKLSDEKSNISIKVYQEDKFVKTVKSNAFGYYQIVGLASGAYTVTAENYLKRKVVLDDDFIFEIDLESTRSQSDQGE